MLEKVAADFKYYQRILELVRDDYFTFVQTFREKRQADVGIGSIRERIQKKPFQKERLFELF